MEVGLVAGAEGLLQKAFHLCVISIGPEDFSIYKYNRDHGLNYKRLSRGRCFLSERLPITTEPQVPVAPLLPRDGVPVGGRMSGIAPISVGRITVGLVLVAKVEPIMRAPMSTNHYYRGSG